MLSSGRLVPGDSLASLFSVTQAPYLKPWTASQPRSRPKGMCLWAGFGGPSFADAHGTTPGRAGPRLLSTLALSFERTCWGPRKWEARTMVPTAT